MIIEKKFINKTKAMNINPYINEKSSDQYDENEKLLHISALPEDFNEGNDMPSPFNNAINKCKF